MKECPNCTILFDPMWVIDKINLEEEQITICSHCASLLLIHNDNLNPGEIELHKIPDSFWAELQESDPSRYSMYITLDEIIKSIILEHLDDTENE